MTVLIFIAMLLCIQVRANYSTYRPHIPRPPPRTRSRPRPLRRIRVKVKSRTNAVVYREGSLSLLDYLIWSHRRKRQRLKNALPGFQIKWWRQKVIFRDGGGLSITPRWHIKHKHAIYRVAIGLLLLVITWQLFGTPIGVVGAVIDSAAIGNWSVGATWVGGVSPGTGDDARIMATHIVTVDQATETTGSCEIQATGTLDLLGNELECDGANGAGFGFDNDGTLNNSSGTIHFKNTAAGIKVDFAGTGNPHHIKVTVNDQTVTQDTACAAEGDFDIFSGIWTTSGTNYQFDVTGYMAITGTLTLNASTVSGGSLAFAGTVNATSGVMTINSESGGGYAFNNDGTFNNNGGTLTFTYAGTTLCDFAGNGNPHNVIVNHASLVLTLDSNTTFASNLTITAGNLTTSGTNYLLTVTANVSVVGTLTGNASAVLSFGSLTITGTYSATSVSTIITSETAGGYAYDLDGTLTHNNGTFTFTYAGTTLIDAAGTGDFYNLIINHASIVFTLDTAMTVANDLTVTTGELDTSGTDYSLTVTNETNVTGTLTLNASTLSLGIAYTADRALIMGAGGTFAGGSGTHSIGSIQMTVVCTVTFTSGTCTFTSGQAQAIAFTFDADVTFAHANGTVVFSKAAAQRLSSTDNSPLTLYNMTVNMGAGIVLQYWNGAGFHLTVANDLTITQGNFDTTEITIGTSRDLTVTNLVNIYGTLTCNASTISLGAGTANTGGLKLFTTGTFAGGSGTHTIGGYYLSAAGVTMTMTSGTTTVDGLAPGLPGPIAQNSGTFNHANGTVTVTYSVANMVIFTSTTRQFYNFIINTTDKRINPSGSGGQLVVVNDFTITTGEYNSLSGADHRSITVTGDADVTGTLTGNASAISLGSLTINSGGEYDATSGTTTITAKSGGFYSLINNVGGTFTHNNGNVTITMTTGNTFLDMSGTGNVYDLVVNSANSLLQRTAITIDNDLTITAGELTTLGGGMDWDLTVTATTEINGGALRCNASTCQFGASSYSGWGLNVDGGTFVGGSGAHSMANLRMWTGTVTLTSGNTTLTNIGSASLTLLWSTPTFDDGNGTIIFARAGVQYIYDANNTARTIYNMTVNDASCVVQHFNAKGFALTIDNDFTVAAGSFSTVETVTGTSRDLIVTGDVDITGTIDGNASTLTFGSLTIQSGGNAILTTGTTEITSETAGGYALFVVAGGILTTSPGTIDFQITSGPTNIQTTTEALFNVLVSGTQTVTITDATTIGGTLTIEAGAGWDSNATDQDLTVTGTTSVSGTLTCNSSALDMAAVSIESGGTLTAPDGSGSFNISGAFDNTGTFTHSDGTVTFDPTGNVIINASGTVEPAFYNLVLSASASNIELRISKDITVENAITITTGEFRPNAANRAVTITVGTNVAVGTITNNSTLQPRSNTTNRVTIAAASDAYPISFTGTDMDWDGGGAASILTLQDCTYNPNATIGTNTVTVTAISVDFRGTLTVTTATLEGTMCVIDVTNLTVSSGLYIEGWFDPTDATRGGYDWILVAGDYTLSTNKTYTSRRNFYKVGGATLTLDTGTSLTVTDATVDGTFITAEADLLDVNNGTFTVKYNMDFKIVDALGDPIQSVVITLYDQFDVQLWTQTTDSNGDITTQSTITAIYGIGARQNHPQNLTMVLTGYQTLNYNFVLNRPMDLTLGLPAAAIPATGGDSAYTDTITIYRKIGRDDAAQKTYDGGTSVTGSVQQKRVEIKGDTGKVINSVTVIYVPAATIVDVEDKIVLEDTTTVQVTAVKTVNAYDGSIEHKVVST